MGANESQLQSQEEVRRDDTTLFSGTAITPTATPATTSSQHQPHTQHQHQQQQHHVPAPPTPASIASPPTPTPAPIPPPTPSSPPITTAPPVAMTPTTTTKPSRPTAAAPPLTSFQEQQLQLERELERLKAELNSSRATLNRRHIPSERTVKIGTMNGSAPVVMEDVATAERSGTTTVAATPSSTTSSTSFFSSSTAAPLASRHSQPRSRAQNTSNHHGASSSLTATLPLSPSPSDASSEVAEEIEVHFPDAKKPKRRHSPILESIPPTLPSSSDDQQQQSSLLSSPPHQSLEAPTTPNYNLDQFQLMRDANEDGTAAYPYQDSNVNVDPLFMQDDDHDQQAHVYAGMNAIMNDISDGDLIMAASNEFDAPVMNTTSEISNGSDSTSSSSSMSSTTSPALISPFQASRMKLESLIAQRRLQSLEEYYLAGKCTFDELRFEMIMIYGGLEEEHEKELLESFDKMRVKDDAVSNNSEASSSSSDPSSVSVIHRAVSSLPDYSDRFTPNEPVEDDPDGLARMRMHFFYSQDPVAYKLGQEEKGKEGKRRRDERSEEEEEAEVEASDTTNTNASSVATSAVSSPTDSSYSSSSTLPPATPTPPDPAPPAIHRMLYVNRAFERLMGFTQAQLRAFGVSGLSPFDLSMRKDHFPAFIRLQKRWRNEDCHGAKLFQVLSRADGVFIYCHTEWKVKAEHGRMTLLIVSWRPISENDPEYSIPPFVEGVDLDEDTLLYGHKPPMAEKTTTER